MQRRRFLQAGAALAGLTALPHHGTAKLTREAPILVVVELSGGNDGLNSIVPFADDAYYRHRPGIGIRQPELLPLDDHFGFNPGMLGLQRLWQRGQLAIVHGCGYAQPSYSHFTSMAYWHTGVPHRGNEFGWLGRVADQMASSRRDDMLVNVASTASLAVKSKVHTPVVFDDPDRFWRNGWLDGVPSIAVDVDQDTGTGKTDNTNAAYLEAVNRSAQQSSARIRQAWNDYTTPVDYGIAPMDLPKVAACIEAGLNTQIYHVAFRNNAFDTHVAQPALHRRLLSYACDGIHGFIRDVERLQQAHRVVVLVYSEFGRRVSENANQGTDHGTANAMFLAGVPVTGGHYGQRADLVNLVEGDNLAHTTDFRQVYATVMERWLGVPAKAVLFDEFAMIDALTPL
ncbi:MAG: DUF1501 domain-containing protein [bacterium]